MKFFVSQLILLSAISQAQVSKNLKPIDFINHAKLEFGIANQPKSIWSYVKDINWNGKTYEMYQTQGNGTNMLDTPEEIRTRAAQEKKKREKDTALVEKRGFYPVKYWQQFLSMEGLFEAGMGLGKRTVSSADVILADRDAGIAGDLSHGIINEAAGPWVAAPGVGNRALTLQIIAGFRLPFDRMARISGYIEGNKSLKPTERGLQESGASFGGGSIPSHGVAAEHDVWIFPGRQGYLAFTAGVYAATNYFKYKYEQKYIKPHVYSGSAYNPVTGKTESVYKDVEETHVHYVGDDEEYNTHGNGIPGNPIHTKGYTVSVRKVWFHPGYANISGGPNVILEVKTELNKKGVTGALVQLKFSGGFRFWNHQY